MICEVCGTYFLDEECLSRLFVFEDICMSCREALKPRLLFEVFPIAYGEVHYYYLYEDLKISYYIKRKLASKLERLYQMIIDEGMKYDLIVFLDDDLFTIYFNSGIIKYKIEYKGVVL